MATARLWRRGRPGGGTVAAVSRLPVLWVAVPALALPLTIAPLSAAAPHPDPATVAPRTCAPPNKTLLHTKPQVTKLPKGGRLRVWDTGRQSNGRGVRVSEVYVPASSPLKLRIWSSGSLTSSRKPTDVLAQHSSGVAISNADVFDPNRGSLPQGVEIIDGTVDKAERTPTNALVISKSGSLGQAHIALTGHVTAAGHTEKLSGLNWQSLAGSGINVYQAPWGKGSRPAGSVDVVVHDGTVKAVRHSGLGQPPQSGQQILTGTGSAASFLDRLHTGEKVAVHEGFKPDFHYGETPFKVYEAVDHDAPFWLDGQKWPVPCTARNENRWSRTGAGWDRKGDFFLVTVSAADHGTAGGGATADNLQYYLHQLGAYNADGFDCDTSTTLAVRAHIPGRVNRVDHTNSWYERPVPNYLGVG